MGCWLSLLPAFPTLAEEALPPLCPPRTAMPKALNTKPASEPEDCIEMGAAVGELGLGWRQKLPAHVRWLTRKDAAAFCLLNQTALGHKVDTAMLNGGCVYLAPDTCTIVTSGPVASASIGNAVRHCVP